MWHAQRLLREFRGDGHIAVVTIEGLSGIEALGSHGASGDVPAEVLKSTRAWSDEAWAAGWCRRVTARGLVDESGAFTEAGRAQRRPHRGDPRTLLATAPVRRARRGRVCAQLRATGRKLTARVIDAGLLVGTMRPPPTGDD